MIQFFSKNCTRDLDSSIHEARLRYAQERDDFHSFFPNMTSVQIREMLRGLQRSDTHREIVYWLFAAQQESPHDLWRLLLVQACEAELVARRRTVSNAADAQLDHLVFDTFIDALNDIPRDLETREVSAHVLRTSAHALTKALRREHGTTRADRQRAAQGVRRARRTFRQTPLRLVGSPE
jgi:hypothetical protein